MIPLTLAVAFLLWDARSTGAKPGDVVELASAGWQIDYCGCCWIAPWDRTGNWHTDEALAATRGHW